MRDELYKSSCTANASSASSFVFDEKVAAVFDDMIERSVPTYSGSLDFIAKVWKHWQIPGAIIYDLGCSTGAVFRRMLEVTTVADVTFVGIDNSAPMLQRAQQNLADLTTAKGATLELNCLGIEQASLKNATGVILNYTLQFLAPLDRVPLLSRIHQELKSPGFLVLSEKIHHADEATGALLNEMHFDFKREQGYSDLEIARKRAALENVLVPWTLEENLAAIRSAGFETAHVVLLWCNFATILARKH